MPPGDCFFKFHFWIYSGLKAKICWKLEDSDSVSLNVNVSQSIKHR